MRRIVTTLLATAAFALSAGGQTATPACSAISLGDLGSLNGWVPSPNDPWHQDISAQPVDPKSDTIMNTPGDLANRYLHPDFSNVVDGAYGIPYTIVDGSTINMVSITPYDSGDSDNTLYPLTPATPIELSPGQCWNDANDHHAIVIDRRTCVAYEVYNANLCNGSWSSYGNVIWDFSQANGEKRPYGISSVDAAGLSVFEGLVRYDEIVAGAINHAIRFTAVHTKQDNANGYFTAPATHAAGNLWGTDDIMGMRIRLKATFDVSSYSTTNQIILNAMKKYGMILADNGSDMFFQGTPDPRWNDNDLSVLKAIPSTAFEVVQMGSIYDANTAPTGPAPNVSITASATSVSAGTPVTLTPTTDGSYEFIDVTGFTRGPVTVTPNCTTTYTLWSRNMYDTSTASVTVTVPGTTAGNCSSTPTTAPTLTFGPYSNVTYGVSPFTVSATSNSTGAITYSVVSGPATVSGSIVTVTGTGAITLQASQAAAGTYSAATATASFTATSATPTLAFNTIGAQSYPSSPFAVSATSNSTGAITYTVVSGPATIAGSTLTLTGTGTVALQASQAATSTYTAATATTSFAVTAPTAPTLTITPISNQTYGVSPFLVSATSNSTGAITYSVVSGPATISSNAISITGTGTVTVKASQAAAGAYTAATATASFTVSAATPTLTFAAIANQTYPASPLSVSATSNSSAAITYTVVSGPATIAGTTVTLTGTGTVVLQASQAASANYTAATATTSFSVATAGTPNLVFTPVTNQSFGVSPFAISATSNSTGAITYTVVSGPATISGNTVTVTGVGSVTLKASQAAAGSYTAASVTTTFTVSAATPTLSFAAINSQTYPGPTVAVSATSNSTGAITYAITSGPATIAGSVVTLSGTGTVTVQASQAATTNFTATTASTSFSVSSSITAPTLVFNTVSNQTYGAPAFAVSAWSTSTGAITYSVVSGPATIAGNMVTVNGAGTVVLKASQAAAGSYSATSITTSFSVNAATPTLALASIPSQTYPGSAVSVSATSTSSGAITYSVISGPATIAGNTVSLTGGGTVVVQASQAATANYNAATATTSFVVTAAGAPTLVFTPIANQSFSSQTFAVSATSNSTGAITYSVLSGPAIISGNAVTITGIGTVVLQASQAATSTYTAAAVTTSFTVSAIAPALTFNAVSNQSFGAAPFAVSATSNSTGAIIYAVLGGPATISGNMVTVTGAGMVTLQASQAAAGNYGAAAATTVFTVSAVTPTLSLNSIPTQTYGAAPFAVSSTSNSPGAITYAITSGPATMAGNVISITGAGVVVVQASQAAAGGFNSATVSTTFTVNPTTPSISFAVPAQTYGGSPVTLAASSNSPGAITYSLVNGPASLSGNALSTLSVGTVTVQATQAASTNFIGATVSTSFVVNPAMPTISIASIPQQTYGSGPITASATSNSAAPITFSVLSGPATVSGTSVTLTGAGNVTLQASQPAAGNYLAGSATTVFTVSPSSVLLAGDFTVPSNQTITVVQGKSANLSVPVVAVNGFDGAVAFQCTVPTAMSQTTCTGTTAQLTSANATTSTITVTTKGPQVTTSSLERTRMPGSTKGLVFLGVLLPCGLPFLSRRRRINLRSFALGILLLLSMAAATLTTTGCGATILDPVTAPGTYVLNVHASSGSNVHAMTVTVVVQPGTNQ